MKNKEYKELLECGHINLKQMPQEQMDQLFMMLNSQMTTIYQFVLAYTDYMNTGHDHQSKENLTMLEAHLLTDICDLEDQTVTKLARAWHRSTSATSQTIRKLIAKGLVTRENSQDDAKIFYLRPTEEGHQASEAHKRYDSLDIIKTLKCLNHTLSYEEIETMFKGLKVYTDLLHRGN